VAVTAWQEDEEKTFLSKMKQKKITGKSLSCTMKITVEKEM